MSNTITLCPRCGKRMLSGQRFEATRTVDVLVCLGESGCGWEEPPLGACCGARPLEPKVWRSKRDGRLERVCACGRPFLVWPYQIKRGGGTACSSSCAGRIGGKRAAANAALRRERGAA